MKFWEFKNFDNNQAELLLYGEIKSEKSWIEEWLGGSGVYADEFIQDLRALGNVSLITVRINSVGGDIFAAVAIYTQLMTHAARVVCIVDGLAASAATIILMAGDEIQMPTGAMLMIHDPLVTLYGLYKADELAKHANTLNTIKESIISVYAKRTKTSTDTISEMMSEETWMTTDQAVEAGFCDTTIPAAIKTEMKGRTMYVNNVEHDLSQFRTVPELQDAHDILDAISTANAGNDILTEFVALARAQGTAQPDPDETDNPDGRKNKPKGADETVDQGTGPACDGCDGDGCDGCPCQDCDEDSCDDCACNECDGVCQGCPCVNCTQDSCQDCEKASHTTNKAKNRKSVSHLLKMSPKACSRMLTRARAEERRRIQDIDAIAAQVPATMVNKAKYEDRTMTARDLAYAQLQATKTKGAAFLAGLEADTAASGVRNVGGAPNDLTDLNEDQQRLAAADDIAKAADKILNKRRV